MDGEFKSSGKRLSSACLSEPTFKLAVFAAVAVVTLVEIGHLYHIRSENEALLLSSPLIPVSNLSQLRQLDSELLGLSSIPDAVKVLNKTVLRALQDLGNCESFDCLHRIHKKLQGKTKFNLPHFMIVGWQKCATTSIYRHLARHPEIAKPFVKEPHFFTSCQRGGPACRVPGGNNEKAYLRDTFQLPMVVGSGLQLATMDASVDYAQYAEEMPKLLRKLFPWLKLVFVMRERIGRAMSWKTMMGQKFSKGCPEDRLYHCLKNTMQKGNYTTAMSLWLDQFPSEQVHVIQFEELNIDPETTIYRLKKFLGLETNETAAEFRNVNQRKSSSGWPLSREEYIDLMHESRQDAEKLAAILEDNMLYSGKEWMLRWDEVWERNLASCGARKSSVCSISSS